MLQAMIGFVVFLICGFDFAGAATQRLEECSTDEVVSLLAQSFRPKHVARESNVVGQHFSWDEVAHQLEQAGAAIERTTLVADEVGHVIEEAGVEISTALHDIADAIDLIADGGFEAELKVVAAAAKLTLLYLKERNFRSSAEEAFKLLKALGAVAKTLRNDFPEYKKVGDALKHAMDAVAKGVKKIKKAIEIQDKYRLANKVPTAKELIILELPTLHELAEKLREWGMDVESTTAAIRNIGSALGVAGAEINLAFQLIAGNVTDIAYKHVPKFTEEVNDLVAATKDIINAIKKMEFSAVVSAIMADFAILAQILQDVKAFFDDLGDVKDGITLVVETLKKLVADVKCNACIPGHDAIVNSVCRCKVAPTPALTSMLA